MSMTDRELDAAVAAVSRMVVGEEPLEHSLQRVVQLTRANVPGADSVTLTLVGEGPARTAASTDTAAVAIDEAQYASDSGPCLDAARLGAMVRVDAVEGANRWPAFEVAASREAVRASLSVPLLLKDGPFGAINVYSETKRPWTSRSERAGALLAGQAATAVINAIRYEQAILTAGQLEQAAQSRDLIGQAKGILMERHELTADDAFERLRDASQRLNLKLRDVAATLAATGALPPY